MKAIARAERNVALKWRVLSSFATGNSIANNIIYYTYVCMVYFECDVMRAVGASTVLWSYSFRWPVTLNKMRK